MRALRSAAVLPPALSTLLVAPGSASAEATRGGVDITPPAVGSCHAMTFDEAMAYADPDPAVDCTTAHTSVTVKVVTFTGQPDWTDGDALYRQYGAPCSRAELALVGGKAKALQMSAYDFWVFFPTKAQRDAGANWVRCDVLLPVGKTLTSLPTDGDPELGAPPLADDLARCKAGKARSYLVTACSGPHAFRATTFLKHRGTAYPGRERLSRWTNRRCWTELGHRFGYYTIPNAQRWRAGLRYSICFTTTKS